MYSRFSVRRDMMKNIKKYVIPAVLILAFVLSACGQSASAEKALDVNDGRKTVKVRNIDEFIGAIAPDTSIMMQSGIYELDKASTYGKVSDRYYRWEETYDGYELVITGADNLSISAADDADVTISATPRYANVLRFENCDGLVIDDLTCGHTKEPGACSGGVIRLENTDRARINDCDLYGCGIIGVDAYKCSELYVTDCDIYECSFNAVAVNGCRDVRIIDCDIYKCQQSWGSIFDVCSTNGFAVVNCEIEDNTSQYLLMSSFAPETYLLGCETKNNTFVSSVFCISGKAPVVEGTYLHENAFTAWYDSSNSSTPGTKCLDRAGNELTNSQLENMEHRDCSYDGPVVPEKPASPEITVDANGNKVAYVKTADDFLAAIQPGVNISLDTDVIDLSKATDFGSGMSDYYYWRECYDGAELVISNVDGLSITSEIMTLIEAVPRYANVICFENCNDLWLSGFTAGHTTAPGACSGGVLYFSGCTSVGVDGCSLYGCGILGITADNTDGLTVTGTEIYDCSYGAVSLSSTHDTVFKNCNIHDCPHPEITLFDSSIMYDNGNGKTEFIKEGNYTLTVENLPVPYVDEVLYVPETARIIVSANGGVVDWLKLGKNDQPVQLYAVVEMPEGEKVDADRIQWRVSDSLMFSGNGAFITLSSNLEEDGYSELYVEYLDSAGNSLAFTCIPVNG